MTQNYNYTLVIPQIVATIMRDPEILKFSLTDWIPHQVRNDKTHYDNPPWDGSAE